MMHLTLSDIRGELKDNYFFDVEQIFFDDAARFIGLRTPLTQLPPHR